MTIREFGYILIVKKFSGHAETFYFVSFKRRYYEIRVATLSMMTFGGDQCQ
jgi:hypothetical protein